MNSLIVKILAWIIKPSENTQFLMAPIKVKIK